MAKFPNTFIDEHIVIYPGDLDDTTANSDVENLLDRSYLVAVGLSRNRLQELSLMANTNGDLEFYTNALIQGWDRLGVAESQLAKNGGRAVFRLEPHGGRGNVTGIAVTGRNETSESPDYPHSLDVRFNRYYEDEGLSLPLTRIALAATVQLYEGYGIGSEAWKSNVNARKIINDAGGVLMHEKSDRHITSVATLNEGDGMTTDVRQFYGFPHTLKP